MSISPDQLARTIEKELREYADVTEDAVGAGVIEVSKKCVEELQSANPPGSGKYGSWSKYNMGWTSTKLKANKTTGYSQVVHNKTHYQLAHLLENGHALKGGSRASAFPHIAPVAENAESTLLETIKKYIQ